MRKKIKNSIFENTFLFNLALPLAHLYYFFLLKKYLPAKWFLKSKFSQVMGHAPNFDSPITINEKLNWLKLNSTSTKDGRFADKYRVRSFIKELWGEEYLIPLLYETKNAADIQPKNLPDIPFIIKTNHDSSGGIIVMDKTDPTISWTMIRNTLRWNMAFNYYWNGREVQYKEVKPHIVVEQLLFNENGDIPEDYKLHYFNGKLAIVQVDTGRMKDHKRNLYDSQWNPIECSWEYPVGDWESRPELFENMRMLGETIAKDFSYIRVDFYNIGDKLYFGEITFHAGGGLGRFYPASFDAKFGEMLVLPIQKKVS
ncbi:MAG: glycosyl transferase [Flavobacteriaceae bacterium]|nr:glycosyl transferase [Flavobacteriaceae bacterium]